MAKLYTVKLTLDELMLIDGKSNEEVQKIIEQAKFENSFGLDDFSNEILRKAVENGKIEWSSCKISSCQFCDKKSGYYTFTRNTRYHRKGGIDYRRPFEYSGIKPFCGFIIFNGVSGICSDCWYNKFIPKIYQYILDNDLKVELIKYKDFETKYYKDKSQICYNCEKLMYESEMGKERTFFNDGWYNSICPYCGAGQKPFGKTHKTSNKFRMLTKDELDIIKKEHKNIKPKLVEAKVTKTNPKPVEVKISETNIDDFPF